MAWVFSLASINVNVRCQDETAPKCDIPGRGGAGGADSAGEGVADAGPQHQTPPTDPPFPRPRLAPTTKLNSASQK